MHRLALILLVFISCSSIAQEASLVWYESFGAEGNDVVESVKSDYEGNLYVLGTIDREEELISEQNNMFVARFSSKGNLEWKNEVRCSGNDRGICMLIDQNNDVLVLASSNSNDGVFSNNKGYEDLYLLKFSKTGEIIEKKQFGGEFIDLPSSIIATYDGNFLISGHSRSTSGALSNNKGQLDFWVIKVDPSGNTIWEKTYGGTDEDYSVKAIQLRDGNYMLLGHSTSIDFDVPDNYGDLDISLMKLSTEGEILWQDSYGGRFDDTGSDIIELDNGHLLIAGNTFSDNIDVSMNNGNSDGWLFEVDETGDLVWERTYGDKGNDYISSMNIDNGTIRILGSSTSANIQGKVNNGEEDIWVFELDSDRSPKQQYLIGGNSFEDASSFILLPNNELLITGRSNSRDAFGNKSGDDYDGFLAKIRLGELNNLTSKDLISVHPNPSEGIFYLNNVSDDITLRLINSSGQEIPIDKPFTRVSTFVIDLSVHDNGVYFLEITSSETNEVVRLIKK